MRGARWCGPLVCALGALVWVGSLVCWWLLVSYEAYARVRGPADLSVYLDASGAPQEELYAHGFGAQGLPYLYPPFAVLPFRALAGTELDRAHLVVSALSLLALAAAVLAAARLAGRRLGPGVVGGALALAGVALWTEPVLQNLDFGQVNLVLLALVLVDLAQGDGRRFKGVGVGLAAGLKLTPGLFVVYLLLSGRRRAAGVAAAVFAATVAVGWVLMPEASAAYWGGALTGRADGRDYLPNQSLNGVLVRLGLGAEGIGGVWWAVLAAVVALAGVAAAVRLAGRGAELLAVCVVGAVTLLCSPLSWTHHWVWVAPVLVLVVDAAARAGAGRAWWWPVGLCALFAAWPMRVDGSGGWDPGLPMLPYGLLWYVPHWHRERMWDPFHVVAGNFYVWLGLGLVVWAVLRARRAVPLAPARPVRVPGPAAPGASAQVGERVQ
ncbi:glycosyltransferase 87 family protein [Streptomyces sp. NPDC001941]|uniref:glycosyltransferase 87 family protein n=1 Tax=Streptomyces sp. NPDC001941 TaxID=3154659 RepID=UPI00332E0981